MLGFVRGGDGSTGGGTGGVSAGGELPGSKSSDGFTERDQEALATAARGYSDAHTRGSGLGFGPDTRRQVGSDNATGSAASSTVARQRPPPPAPAPPTSALARLQQRTRDALAAATAADRTLGGAAAGGSRPPADAVALLTTEADARRRADVIAAVASADVESLADALPPSLPPAAAPSLAAEARHASAMFAAPRVPPPPPPPSAAGRYDSGAGGAKRQRSPAGPRDAAADANDDDARRRRQRAPLPQTERELDDRFRDDSSDEEEDGDGNAAHTTPHVTQQHDERPNRSWRELVASGGGSSSALLHDESDASAATAHQLRAPAAAATSDGGASSGQLALSHAEPLLPLYTQLKLGHRVQARWATDGHWYPATVVSVTHAGYSNAVYAVSYDGLGGGSSAAAVEHGLSADRLRRLAGVDYSRDPPPLPEEMAAAARGVLAGGPGSFLARLHARTGSGGTCNAAAPSPLPDEAAAVDAAAELLVALGPNTSSTEAAAAASAAPPLTGVLRALAGCLPDERFSGGVDSGRPLCGALAAGLAPHLAPSSGGAANALRCHELCPRGDHCKQKHAHPGTLARLHARAVQRAGELQRERAAAADSRRRAAAVAAVAGLDAAALAAPGLVSAAAAPAAAPAPVVAAAAVAPAPPAAPLSLTDSLVRGALLKPGTAVTASSSAPAAAGAPSWRQRLAERAAAPAPGKG